jgi:Domain of unknown function (DUF6434)
MAAFNEHSGAITRGTPITKSYRNTRKVRRFFRSECGDGFKFDRPFIAWSNAADAEAMAEAVDEWNRRQAIKR